VSLRLALLLVVVLVAACGGDGDDEAAGTTESAPEATSCEPATSDLMTPIGNKVTLDGGRVRNGQMVDSEAVPGVWFVAVELDGVGYEDEGDVATFATLNRFGGDAIYAVDELANEHTDWSDVAQADGIDAADPAADEAGTCVVG
jgi:hypothetical protein